MEFKFNAQPITVIFSDGTTASFENCLFFKQCTTTSYIIYFATEHDGVILHIEYDDVACIVAGLVDILG